MQKLAEQIEERRTIRDHVARLLYREQLGEYERQLIKYIKSDELAKIMAGIRKAASGIEAATSGSRYNVGSLEIKLPHLYATPTDDNMSGNKITI